MTKRTAAWSVGPSGLSLSIRLTPKGGRDAIDGIEELADGRAVLKARVAQRRAMARRMPRWFV